MNADKIKRLREIGEMFDNASKSGEWELPKLFREAADELERLGKIEAAAKSIEPTDEGTCGLWNAVDRLIKTLNDMQRQIGGPPE